MDNGNKKGHLTVANHVEIGQISASDKQRGFT
jgi:hypothetical protein